MGQAGRSWRCGPASGCGAPRPTCSAGPRCARCERQLAEEYKSLVTALAPKVDADNVDKAVELASLPDGVRGYEDVKLRNVEHYHSELARLRSQFNI